MIIIKNIKKRFPKSPFLVLLLFFNAFVTHAQTRVTVRGTVTDKTGDPIIGAVITAKAENTRKVLTDKDGKFEIAVPANNTAIIVSSFGMGKKEITASVNGANTIVLEYEVKAMNEVIVVGYGQQKKASVVGAITQTSGKELEHAGGVTNLGMALTGNLPGLTTISSSGQPGGEDPQIVIRGVSSWNSSSPLILVDGVERSMSSLDISSVETVTILKDASATAVYGVRGGNGVILITTKRGVEGKAQVQARSNVTTKIASKLPKKYDSYDALMIKNRIVERESMVDPNVWSAYTPMDIIYKYRYPANRTEQDRYPNVDWEKELFKSSAQSYNSSVNVSGGAKSVRYFAGVDFTSEGDLFKTFQNNRGYDSNFGFSRINVRSNLDFNVTKTTTFSTNLFASNAVTQVPWNLASGDGSYWSSAYRTAPDSFPLQYQDGNYGFYLNSAQDQPNAAFWLAYSGLEKRTATTLTTDFIIKQDLGMVIKGLSFNARLSLDNGFSENNRGIDDRYHSAQREYIDPITGQVTYEQKRNTGTQFDFSDAIAWTTNPGAVDVEATRRNMNYKAQLDYIRSFGGHNVTALAVFQRSRNVLGSKFPSYREDWTSRLTYNYKQRYNLEVNGSYNGSEKFGPNYRFAFFPSVGANWSINNESFMKEVRFVEVLKIRGSWGRVGDDNVGQQNLYNDSYVFNGNTQMGSTAIAVSPTTYTIYRQNTLGNPSISWETVDKRNIGLDFALFKGDISGSLDVFKDHRTRVMIGGTDRAVPSFFGFGTLLPQANLGEVTNKGYEVELKFGHTFGNGMRLSLNTAMTHNTNKIIFADDPSLTPAYQQKAGYAIGRYTTYIDNGFIKSWDDLYGSTARANNNRNRLPGDYNIVDFNGDGIIDDKDQAPNGYTGTPQNTYNANFGFEYKRFSVFVQFYGVNNVTRQIQFPDYQGKSNVVFVEKPFYYVQNGGGEVPPPRFSVADAQGANGTRYFYDGSYMRLKNAEIGYSLPLKMINKLGIKTCRFYVNGDNLLLWTKMPDDRESNFASGSGDPAGTGGAYPTMKRFNLGIDITL